MKSPDLNASQPKPARRACIVCGKPSAETICDPCAMKIHLDALARKTHEEKGAAWAKWDSPEPHNRRR